MFPRSFFVATRRSPDIKNYGAVRVLFSNQCNTKPGVIGTIVDSIRVARGVFQGEYISNQLQGHYLFYP